MLLRVALVRTHISEERNTSIIRVKRIGELGILEMALEIDGIFIEIFYGRIFKIFRGRFVSD
jgi:hypothetical protein